MNIELRTGETIEAEVHQHWFVMIPPVSILVIGVIALVLFSIYVPFDFYGYALEVYGVILLVLVAQLLYRAYLWRHNMLTITNLRVVNTKQAGIFDINVTEVLYGDITDISYTQDGVMASAYNYGTLSIRLPSQNQVTAEDIPEPAKVIELINQIRVGQAPQPQSVAPPQPSPAPAPDNAAAPADQETPMQAQ